MAQARSKEQPKPKAAEINRLFAQEVKRHQDRARQQAVESILSRRDLLGQITVGDYLNRLQRDAQEMWDVIAAMELVAFADSISNSKRLLDENRRLREELATLRSGDGDGGLPLSTGKRSRLTRAQKDGLKQAVLDVLVAQPEGLGRAELAAGITEPRLRALHLRRQRLHVKLRIPLLELQKEGRLHTVGEKRFTRYLLSRTAEQPQ